MDASNEGQINKQNRDDRQNIFIIGLNRFQNELMECFILKETGLKCTLSNALWPILSIIKTSHNNKNVVLYDIAHKSVSNLLYDIKDRDEEILKKVWLAFFNTPLNAEIEKRALKEGVRGFFYEKDSKSLFIKGIKTLCEGQLWISRDILTTYILENEKEPAKQSIKPPSNLKLRLTQREIEILGLVTVGAKNEDIAEKLFISPHTVKTHLYNVFKKIDVKNRFQAALWAANNINQSR